MKASEIMTKRVISIEPEATIVQAIKLMLKNHLSGLPVIDRPGNLLGIITEGDFLHRREIGTELKRNAWLDAIFGPEQSTQDYVRAHGIRVAELMTRPPITVDADTSLDRVVHLMERHHIKRVPVLRKGKVVGIISRANLMRALASIHRASSKTSRNDQEIRKRIVADIEKQRTYEQDILRQIHERQKRFEDYLSAKGFNERSKPSSIENASERGGKDLATCKAELEHRFYKECPELCDRLYGENTDAMVDCFNRCPNPNSCNRVSKCVENFLPF